MIYISVNNLLGQMNQHLKGALYDALDEHVKEGVDVNAVYRSFINSVSRRCGESMKVSDTVLVAPAEYRTKPRT